MSTDADSTPPDYEDLPPTASRSDALARALVAMRSEQRVWRVVAGFVVTVALGAGGVGYGAAQQAATDHDRLARVEADMADVHDDIAAISRDLTQIREDVAAIRARLLTGREAEEE